MSAIKYKPIDEITERDLQALIDNKVSEDRDIEYKSELPASSESSRKKYLASASSLANTVGGHLLFGVKERHGEPQSLDGLQDIDPDAEILRLETMLRDGIEPRIAGCRSKSVRLSSGGTAIVMQIPRSWSQPHMITLEKWSRFYRRNSAGKYPMDVSEIRSAFLASESLVDGIRAFRTERVAQISGGFGPVQLRSGCALVLHVMPFSALEAGASVDIASVDSLDLKPMRDFRGWSSRYNFDGFLTYDQDDEGNSTSYIQLFRTGAMEAVSCGVLGQREKVMPSVRYEREVGECIDRLLGTTKSLSIPPPFAVMLSLLDVAGFTMGVSPTRFFDDGHPIDRSNLLVPEVVIDTHDTNPYAAMRPAFDAVWNACGWQRSMNYDEAGSWVGH